MFYSVLWRELYSNPYSIFFAQETRHCHGHSYDHGYGNGHGYNYDYGYCYSYGNGYGQLTLQWVNTRIEKDFFGMVSSCSHILGPWP